MIYLDANFFVFAFFDPTKKGDKAKEIYQSIIQGKLTAFTSVLTLDEIMWVIIRNKKIHLMKEIIESIYATPNLEVREVQPLVPLSALDYILQYNLKPRDAFHIAIMDKLSLKTIVSDDSDFDRVKNIKRIKLE